MVCFSIEHRERVRQATLGSKRRCYDGVWDPDDWEIVWSQWSVLEHGWTKEQADRRLEFWQGLNEYAVNEGRSPSQYRIVEGE